MVSPALRGFLKRTFSIKPFLRRLFRISPVMPLMWPLGKLFLEDPVHIGRDFWLGLVPVYIANGFRDTHEYILGKTGKGKSKYVEHRFTQDVKRGRCGAGVIDPASDLADDILRRLWCMGFFGRYQGKDQNGKPVFVWNEANCNRVVYYEPWRDDYVIPFNVLHIPRNKDGRLTERSEDIAENGMEAFKKAWPDSLREAPRFVDIGLPSFRIMAEAGIPLTQFRKFLTSPGFRGKALARVEDKVLAEDFINQYHRSDDDELRQIDSVWNKLTRFSFYRPLRRTLGQATNVLNFKSIMDEQKILIVNLYRMPLELQCFLGTLITLGFQHAAFNRHSSRVPFYLYLDEFPRFITMGGSSEVINTTLSQCRKYKFYLTLIHQQISQLNSSLLGAFGNIGIKTVFNSDYADAKQLVHALFVPYPNETDHPKVDQLAAVVQRLQKQVALLKVDGWEVGCFRSEPLDSVSCSDAELERLKVKLLQAHGIKASELVDDIDGIDETGIVKKPSPVTNTYLDLLPMIPSMAKNPYISA